MTPSQKIPSFSDGYGSVLLDPLLPFLSHVYRSCLYIKFVHGLDDRCTTSRNDEKEDTLPQLSCVLVFRGKQCHLERFMSVLE